MTGASRAGTDRRALRAFWALTVVAVLAAGLLDDALGAAPSPTTGLRVAGSGLALVASVALAGRVLLALDRARRRSRLTPHSSPSASSGPPHEGNAP